MAPGLVTALARGGQWLVSGSAEGAVCLWHAAVPEARRLVATHRGVVRAIGFDDADQPTQMLLLLGEGELTLWRLPTGPGWELQEPASSGRAPAGRRPLCVGDEAENGTSSHLQL